MVSFPKCYQNHRIGTPSPSGWSRHHRLPLILPYPTSLFRGFFSPLRVTLTHFALSSYERALHFPSFFLISGLARLGVKPRLCRSSWRAFASTHPFLPSSICLCLLSLSSLEPLSFTVESILSFPCSRSDPSLSRQDAALLYLDSLPPHDLVLWTDGSVPFPFGKEGSEALANCSLCGIEATLSFSAGPLCSSISAESCAILHALCWSRQYQQVCHFSSLFFCLTFVLSSPPYPILHLFFYLNLRQIW